MVDIKDAPAATKARNRSVVRVSRNVNAWILGAEVD